MKKNSVTNQIRAMLKGEESSSYNLLEWQAEFRDLQQKIVSNDANCIIFATLNDNSELILYLCSKSSVLFGPELYQYLVKFFDKDLEKVKRFIKNASQDISRDLRKRNFSNIILRN